MKKLLLLIAAATVIALTFTSCNSESRPFGQSYLLSQESATYLVDFEGTRLIAGPGSVALPTLPTGLSRKRVVAAGYYFIDGIEQPDENNRMTVEFYDFIDFTETRGLSYWDSHDYNDPILMPYITFNGMISEDPKPTVICHQNYLDLWFLHIPFTENKTSSTNYAQVDYWLEVDPDIIPSTTSGPDTVRMALKFWNNRADGEKVNTAKAYAPVSFDLEYANEMIRDFEMYDSNQEAITYIIKVEYNSFDDFYYPDDEKTSEKFISVKWSPGDPFKDHSK